MVVGRKHNHKDHDLAFTTLLQTAKKCNVKLNFEKLQYKCTYTEQNHHHSQDAIPQLQKRGTIIYRYDNYLSKFSPRLTELAKPIRELV